MIASRSFLLTSWAYRLQSCGMIFPFSIAKEGIRWFLGLAVLALLLISLSSIAALVAIILGVACALFFRIPKRVAPQGKGIILSPADGKVVGIDEVEETEFIRRRCKRVSIFLSILDVHMNYAPVDGVVEWVRYMPGKFHWAFEPKASDENENQRIGISSSLGNILVRQIAGAVARRIVLFKKVSDTLTSGERIGMIKFGSRVEIYLPMECTICVRVGQRVAGGLTILGNRQ